jgi:hypothetical protein
MLENRIFKSVPVRLRLLAGCAAVLVLSGCATYGTPYGDETR